jgi:hypothetical protein
LGAADPARTSRLAKEGHGLNINNEVFHRFVSLGSSPVKKPVIETHFPFARIGYISWIGIRFPVIYIHLNFAKKTATFSDISRFQQAHKTGVS